jgi:tetratricopeptide (TPR) repeat protein
MTSAADRQKAAQANEEGLLYYRHWEVEKAIAAFSEAAALNPEDPVHHLNLARAQVRFGDFEATLQALGEYLRTETDTEATERFEKLFGNVMDEVETLLTKVMTKHDLSVEIVGASIQMSIEFRIAWGRHPLDIGDPAAWAAALDLTIRKVNFREVPLRSIAKWYGTRPQVVRKHHLEIVNTLDVMPCDYRFFRDDRPNPLDKLVEAAAMLQDLEERFRKL